jgi:hypothetical protein
MSPSLTVALMAMTGIVLDMNAEATSGCSLLQVKRRRG